MKEIVLAVTGASGAPYAEALINRVCIYNNQKAASGSSESLIESIKLYVIFSQTAKQVWAEECGELSSYLQHLPDYIEIIDNKDFNFKHASGSNRLSCMIVLPASMGTIARIAAGISSDLIGRIADVQLKEQRPLIICPRETPMSSIHIQNMLTISKAGGKIFPCSPSFYNRPSTLTELLHNFSARLLETADVIQMDDIMRW